MEVELAGVTVEQGSRGGAGALRRRGCGYMRGKMEGGESATAVVRLRG
jgi:hypothetical protein